MQDSPGTTLFLKLWCEKNPHHNQGRIQEFWKGGPVRGRSPEPSAEGLPENF